ncbi:MAG: hypothetical protein WBA76_18570 [Phormidesmis sp.]
MDNLESRSSQANLPTEKTTRDLAQNFLNLSNSTTELAGKTQESIYELSRLKRTLIDLTSSLKQNEVRNQALATRLKANETALAQLENRAAQIWKMGLVLLLVLCLGGILGIHMTAAQNQRIGWLLYKANRRECIDGVKPANDPQCQ